VGTVNEQLKLPVVPLVQGFGLVVRLVPPLPFHLIVIVLLAANPVPLTVTLLPTFPEAGDSVMEDVTVKVAVAELVPSVA
jgi:hypothetical protein